MNKIISIMDPEMDTIFRILKDFDTEKILDVEKLITIRKQDIAEEILLKEDVNVKKAVLDGYNVVGDLLRFTLELDISRDSKLDNAVFEDNNIRVHVLKKAIHNMPDDFSVTR